MTNRPVVVVLIAALAGCGGSQAKAPQPPEPSAPASPPAAAGAPVEPKEDCPAAYEAYVRAWSDWFDAELDSDAQAAIIAEFGQELPRRAALEEMRATADELRYEPGFELWIRALTATEEAIASCGEGAPRPR